MAKFPYNLIDKEVLTYLQEVPAINNGGCGIAALALYRWLKARNKHHNVKFVYLHFSGLESETNITNLQKGEALVPCSHVVLEIDNKYIDASESSYKELRDAYEDAYKIEFYDEHTLVSSINNNVSPDFYEITYWNTSFKREVFVPEIEKRLSIPLSDILFDNEIEEFSL